MRILGFPDEWAPAGSSAELFDHYGFTGEKLAARVRAERLNPSRP
jgi:transketolase C-terminal domain/subunit